mmetsp:Transcript_40874/g.41750  ORF Transcript_40874/g.41750 Transcript_40874/m.41750 type:complete len:218 (-) Transcript_40874:100-753(-)
MFEADIPLAKKHSTSKERVNPERKKWIQRESALLLTRNMMTRDKVREDIDEQRKAKFEQTLSTKKERLKKWEKMTANSPFAVDLVAEDERIQEENRIRLMEEEEKIRRMNAQKEKAKNDIILKALSESADLEALRREKRAILEEEQRLKALLALEKTMNSAKSERMIVEKAQRQRMKAKSTHRRLLYKDSLDEVIQEENMALKIKHGVKDNSDDFAV